MLAFGIIVEGEYDAAALSEFIRKCVTDELKVITRVCRSQGQLMKKISIFLQGFRHDNQGEAVDRALIIRDADNHAPQELMTKIQASYTPEEYRFPIKPVIIVQELETWLLADSEALSRVSNTQVSEVQETLEEIVDPKSRLKSVLSNAGLPYTKEVARRIAAATSLERLDYRCPSFRNFRRALYED